MYYTTPLFFITPKFQFFAVSKHNTLHTPKHNVFKKIQNANPKEGQSQALNHILNLNSRENYKFYLIFRSIILSHQYIPQRTFIFYIFRSFINYYNSRKVINLFYTPLYKYTAYLPAIQFIYIFTVNLHRLKYNFHGFNFRSLNCNIWK